MCVYVYVFRCVHVCVCVCVPWCYELAEDLFGELCVRMGSRLLFGAL